MRPPVPVSVCIPSYNYGHLITDAIRSALNQTFHKFELIIVDNASVDDTREIVDPFLRSDPRVSYFRNDTTVPMAENWNRCLRQAAGRYINILCADDLLEPTYLEKTVAILDASPNIVLVSCRRLLVGPDLLPFSSLSYAETDVIEKGHSVINTCLRKGNMIGEPTAVTFRRDRAERGFNLAYRHLVDLEMWFHLLEQGDFAFIDESLCKFRQHAGQCTKNNITSLDFADDEFHILREYLGKEYVTLNFLDKQRVKFDKALLVWSIGKTTTNIGMVKKKIRDNYNLNLFYILRAFMNLKQILIHDLF